VCDIYLSIGKIVHMGRILVVVVIVFHELLVD